MDEKKSKMLSLELTEKQLAAIKPLIEETGRVDIAGMIEGNRLHVAYLACNAAFEVKSWEPIGKAKAR